MASQSTFLYATMGLIVVIFVSLACGMPTTESTVDALKDGTGLLVSSSNNEVEASTDEENVEFDDSARNEEVEATTTGPDLAGSIKKEVRSVSTESVDANATEAPVAEEALLALDSEDTEVEETEIDITTVAPV